MDEGREPAGERRDGISVPSRTPAVARWRATLDLVGPFRGPCAFCGFNDARHRVADGLAGQWIAGDTAEALAEDHGYATEVVYAIVATHLLVEATGRRNGTPEDQWFNEEEQ